MEEVHGLLAKGTVGESWGGAELTDHQENLADVLPWKTTLDPLSSLPGSSVQQQRGL